jgi:hypothetical protein
MVAMVSAFKPYRKSVLNMFAPRASGGPPIGAAINKYTKIKSVPMKKAIGVCLVSIILELLLSKIEDSVPLHHSLIYKIPINQIV